MYLAKTNQLELIKLMRIDQGDGYLANGNWEWFMITTYSK